MTCCCKFTLNSQPFSLFLNFCSLFTGCPARNYSHAPKEADVEAEEADDDDSGCNPTDLEAALPIGYNNTGVLGSVSSMQTFNQRSKSEFASQQSDNDFSGGSYGARGIEVKANIMEGIQRNGVASSYFRAIYTEAINHHGSVLQQRLHGEIEDAVLGASQGSVWFSSQPLTTAASRRVFQVPVVGIAIYFLYQALSTWNDPCEQLQASCNWILQDNKTGLVSVQGVQGRAVIAAGLLWDGCVALSGALIEQEGNITESRASESLRFAGRANGFFAVLDGALSSATTATVKAVARNVPDQSEVLASAAFQLNGKEGEERLVADLRLDWRGWLVSVCSNLIPGIGFLLSVAAGALGRPRAVRPIAMTIFACTSLTFWAASIGDALEIERTGVPLIATIQREQRALLNALPPLCLFLGIALCEAYLVSVLFLYSIIHVLTRLFAQILIMGAKPTTSTSSAFLAQLFRPIALLVLTLGLTLTWLRQRTLHRSLQLVRKDRSRYDEAWVALIASNGASSALSDVKAAADALMEGCRTVDDARQYNYKIACSSRSAPSGKPVSSAAIFVLTQSPGMPDFRAPISSLDQLYAAARCLHPFLLAKVKEWALASGGLFPIRRTGISAGTLAPLQYAGLNDSTGEEIEESVPSPLWRHSFARLKSTQRASEKVVRTYKHDVSRLVDVCRQVCASQTRS